MNKKRKFLFYLSKAAEVYPIGQSKYAPGTIASFVAMLISYLLLLRIEMQSYLIFLIFFIIISYIFCEAHIMFYNNKDPKEVVADEFTGQFIAVLACVQSDKNYYVFLSFILSFLLFRFFDITKIGPIKKFENLPNGLGIIADDVAAGLCAFITQAAILISLNQSLAINALWN